MRPSSRYLFALTFAALACNEAPDAEWSPGQPAAGNPTAAGADDAPPAPTQPVVPSIARVAAIEGSPALFRGNEELKAKAGDQLRAGDRIATDAKARAR